MNRAILEWYADAGVDEAVSEQPRDWLSAPPAPLPQAVSAPSSVPMQKTAAPAKLTQSTAAAIAKARELADASATLAELEAAVRGFDGCAIKKSAQKTVFCDGNPQASIMLIGEAPGAQEDQQGIPFCGPSGMLLDKMLAAIGLDRTKVYISNTIFWRPPGNRSPSSEELTICEPFVQKHIALMKPKLLILAGGVATGAVLKKDTSMSRLRGKFYGITNPYLSGEEIPTAVFFHPSYLLRSPGQKRLAWADLLMIKKFLEEKGVA